MAADVVQQSGVVFTLGEFGDWEEVSGGIPTTQYTEHYEAGTRTPDHIPSTTTYTDLVLKRAYRPDRDQRVVTWQKQFALGFEAPRNGVKQIRNFQGIVVNQETYAALKPVSVETPEGKSGDGTIGMITVTMKVTQKL